MVVEETTKKRPGPSTLPFEASGTRSKYKKIEKIVESNSLEALTMGTAVKANKEGLSNTAHILRSLEKSPEKTATHLRKASVAYKKRCTYYFDSWGKLQLQSKASFLHSF